MCARVNAPLGADLTRCIPLFMRSPLHCKTLAFSMEECTTPAALFALQRSAATRLGTAGSWVASMVANVEQTMQGLNNMAIIFSRSTSASL